MDKALLISRLGAAWAESGYLVRDMYLADVYFIDGQVLEPTAFGRYNEDGVWVPREVDFTPAEMRNSDFLFTESSNNTAVDYGTTQKNFTAPAADAFDNNQEQVPLVLATTLGLFIDQKHQ